MSYSRWLLRTELIAASVLGAVALMFAVDAFLADRTAVALWTFGFTFIATISFGALPVMLYGAPIYALLVHRNRATWLRALIVGVIPGLVIGFIHPGYGMLFLVFGAIVAIGTHIGTQFAFRKWVTNDRPAL